MDIIKTILQVYSTGSYMSLRDLHRLLKAPSRFREWVRRRIQKYKFEEGKDFIILSVKGTKANDGRPTIEYFAKYHMVRQLMVEEPSEIGNAVRLCQLTYNNSKR